MRMLSMAQEVAQEAITAHFAFAGNSGSPVRQSRWIWEQVGQQERVDKSQAAGITPEESKTLREA